MLGWRRDNEKEEATGKASPPVSAQAGTGRANPSRARKEKRPAKAPSSPPPKRVRNPRSRLGEILVGEGAVTAAQLKEALAKKEREGGFLGRALVELGYIDQNTLISFLVKQCKIPHLNLLDYEIHEDLLTLIPKEVCLKHNLVPIDKLGRILTVAMVDPLDIEALEEIRGICPDLKIKPILCTWEHYEAVARRILGLVQQGEAELSAKGLGFSESVAPPSKGDDAQPEAGTSTGSVLEAGVQALVAAAGAGEADKGSRRHVDSGSSQGEHDVGGTLAQPTHRGSGRGAPAHQTPQPVAPRSTVSHQEVVGWVREGVGDAVREAVENLVNELRSVDPAKGTGPPPPSPEALAKAVHDAVNGAMREALGSVVDEMRETKKTVSSSTPSVEDLATIVSGSVRDAVQETITSFSDQLSSSSEREKDLVQQVRKAVADQSAETAETLKAVREAIAVLHEAVNASQVMQGEGEQAAEGAVETAPEVRNGESGAPGSKSRATAWQNARAMAKQYASVKLLHKPEQDVIEALEGPGLPSHSDERVRIALESEEPLEGYSFDNFFFGQVNLFTHKLCEAVTATPGKEYNPVFLYGDVGNGKTHLINAVGNAIRDADPDCRVGYVSASRFATRVMDALADHVLEVFRATYCQWDVLILDDIQFLEGRPEAQEEFFHIFNALYQEHRQLVITGDKAPDQSIHLDKRLASRFAGGIVTSLRPPEWETRMQILSHHAGLSGLSVSEEILSLIATRVPTDMRKLAGSLRKVIAFASLVGQDITEDLANEILSHLGITEAA